jgi:ParB/RepB/Spo0J family partition protein
MATTTTTTKKPTSKRSPVKPVEPVTKAGGAVEAVAAGTRLVHEISPALIAPHPKNPRKDLGDLTELADSIRAHGIQQPITVVPRADKDGEYYALLGHRRLAAAKEVNLIAVPVIITPGLDDAAQLEMMLIENLQRLDLTISEEGAGYQGLLDLGATQTAIAKRTGRAKSTVATRVRIASLPEGARYHVDHHQITIEEALALADLEAADAELYAAACNDLANPHLTNPRFIVASAQRKLEEREALEKATAEWKDKGWTLKVGHALPADAHRLRNYGGGLMTPAEHTDCPAGEVWVSTGASWELGNIEYHGAFYCIDAATYHPKELAAWEAARNAQASPTPRELSAEEVDRQKRREAALASRDARHEFLADVLTRDTDDADPIVDFIADVAALVFAGVDDIVDIVAEDLFISRLRCDLPRPIARPSRALPLVLVESVDGLLIGANPDAASTYNDDEAAFLDLVITYIDALTQAGHTLTEHEQQVRAAAVETRDALDAVESEGDAESEGADS